MIPQKLIDTGMWCVWQYEKTDEKGNLLDKPKKVPYNCLTGYRAQSNNPNTFSTFENASAVLSNYDGLGIGIFDDIGSMDIDNCVINGVLNDEAADIVDTMDTYTETSPSGTGIRLLFEVYNFNYNTIKYYINNKKVGLEIYISGATSKFLTVTGNSINNNSFKDCTNKLQQVLDKYMLRNQNNQEGHESGKCILPVDEVLPKAFAAKNGEAIKALFDGDISKYKSNSEADLALCSHLAFWCGRDESVMDELFRQSGLYRQEKWDSKRGSSTYGEGTLKKAIAFCSEVYTPRSTAEDDFKPPYIYLNRNGNETISIPGLREHIKQNNIVWFYQGGFRTYADGYYKLFDMNSFVYMEMPERLRSNKIAEQVTLDLQLDSDLLLNEKKIAGEQYICFKNGVYDLKSRQLIEHNSERIFISQIPHNYNPNAVSDVITESFLQNCCGEEKEQRQLLLEMIGCTISDVRNFKYWFFIQGKKDTGKSTFCALLQKLLTDVDGTKHYSALPLNALNEDEFGLAEVLGKKANIVTDTSNDPIKNLTTIKKLTGGAYEELNCKIKYGVKNAKGVSKALLIFAGNDIPKLWSKGDKTAFLERMILLRFCIVVPKEKQIAGLVGKLNYEYLIKLGIDALHEFMDNNYIFTEPASVIENRQDVLFESDNVYKFFTDACILCKGESIHIAEAYRIFIIWCYANGYSENTDHNQITINTFRTSIIEYGAVYKRSERIGKIVKPAFADFKIKWKGNDVNDEEDFLL